MGEVSPRVTTPPASTDLATFLNHHNSLSMSSSTYMVAADHSPIPGLCATSDAGSTSQTSSSGGGPDLVISRSLSEPNAFEYNPTAGSITTTGAAGAPVNPTTTASGASTTTGSSSYVLPSSLSWHNNAPSSSLMVMDVSNAAGNDNNEATTSSSVPRVVSTLLPSSSSSLLEQNSNSTTAPTTLHPQGGALFNSSSPVNDPTTLHLHLEQQHSSPIATTMIMSSKPSSPGGGSSSSSQQHTKPSAARRKQNTKPKAGGDSTTGGDPAVQRRQKRLERNRESARLSRRRRKQYLEVLEGRVTEYSHEMDIGRRAHVAQAVTTIRTKRAEQLALAVPPQAMETSATNESLSTASSALPDVNDVMNRLRLLQTNLSRTGPELMVATTFRSQQVKSFALPPDTKFILWLTLQSDSFFRGGRAASERLSAARIGERILNSGTDKVTPAQSMWPLLCSEIGLSYEQEERVRNFQRSTLQAPETWVERHTAFAAGRALESVHDALQAVTLRLGQRERSTLGVLTPEQQFKFLAWTNRNRERLASAAPPVSTTTTYGDPKYEITESQHPAANLYVLNHRLQSILQKIPRAAPLVTGATLRKLARRPSFESLGCCMGDKDDEPMSRERSFPSTGSLKRSASEITMDTTEEGKAHIPPISPPEAQETARPTVEQVLGHVKDIIPPPPVATIPLLMHMDMPLPAPTPISSMSQPNLSSAFASNDVTPSTGMVTSQSMPFHPGSMMLQQQGRTTESATHNRKPSFLPPHLSLVPEELWTNDEDGAAAAEDFLMNLVDEDWAIGEGIDMELDMTS